MFEDNKYYSDAGIADAFKASLGTIHNWRRDYGFPTGDLFGRLRRTPGLHINRWIAARPRDKVQLPPGMGSGRRPGRPRKISADLTAA